MSRKTENTAFVCANCSNPVLPLTNGGYRNHCPRCLYSLHVDLIPGDRASDCGGLMEPVGVAYHSKKGYQIRHRCIKCSFEGVNKIADDPIMPDDYDQIISLFNNRFK